MKMCNTNQFINKIFSLFVVLFYLISLTFPAEAAELPERFEFRGSGYGHGVGMSQFGAYGQALEGKSAQEIVGYYYPGTTIESVDDSQFVRVNIADKVATVGFSIESLTNSTGPLQVFAGDLPPEQATTQEPASEVAVGDEVLFSTLGGTLITSILNNATKQVTSLPSPEGNVWTLRWPGTLAYPGEASVVKMRQGSIVRKYKYGQIQIRFLPPVAPAIQGSIIATTTLRIHSEYLRGLGEVSSSWPAAALQAQVIAARSFALSKAATFRKSCDCHLYSSVKDQNFVGYSKESEPGWGQKWVDAVTATEPEPGKGLAVLYNGKVITAYYASSTGGLTQDVAEVWGSPTPYLIPVPDPWSLDPLINPTYSSWVRQINQSDFAAAFSLPDVMRYEITSRTKAGGVKTIVAYSSSGKSTELSGEQFRSLLKLPSTWISRTVNRVSAQSADELAVAVSRSAWPSAKSAVLVNFQKDPATSLTALSYANAMQLPILNVTNKGLGKATQVELQRRKINSVILVGRPIDLPKNLKFGDGNSAITQTRFTGRNEIEVSEKLLSQQRGEPVVLISSEKSGMIDDAARILASGRPIVWSRDYLPSSTLEKALTDRNQSSIFYGDLPDFRFPTRIVITKSSLAAFISSSWQSPIVYADGTEMDIAGTYVKKFPNVASITVIDKDLPLTPFQGLS